MVAVAVELVGGGDLALFAAFGGFATLLFVEFAGPMRARISAQLGLVLAGAVLICLGTLASRTVWTATSSTFIVSFVVLFVGLVSSVLASAGTALLVSFILPVTLPGSVESIPDRLGGWLLAGAASLLAITVLWPAPVLEPLRLSAARACALQASRLRAEADCVSNGFVLAGGAIFEVEADEATAAATELRLAFSGASYQPTGLAEAERALVRLIDQVVWLDAILRRMPLNPRPRSIALAVCEVKTEAATLLGHSAVLLESAADDPRLLDAELRRLFRARQHMEHAVTSALPLHPARVRPGMSSDSELSEFMISLEPAFRAQEMTCAVSVIATQAGLLVAARRRGWRRRLLGRPLGGTKSALASAREDLRAHAERHSVWFHNSARGAAALGLAVLVAELTGVLHSFWVVFGALAVLRTTALNTGRNALRGLLGAGIGFLVGGGLVLALGTSTTVYWLLLPVAVACAGLGDPMVSFTLGQAGFTTASLILYSLISPGGWELGLVRIADIAIGCAVSLFVGVLFWPRGANSALGKALAEAFFCGALYLQSAVEFALTGDDGLVRSGSVPSAERRRAASAATRLDDALRNFLAERGTKQVPLAGVTALTNAVVVLRFTAEAVLRLWQCADRISGQAQSAASAEVLHASGLVFEWYAGTARALEGRGMVPAPIETRLLAGRLFEAVGCDVVAANEPGSAETVRMIWTADHIDVVQRLQAAILEPARAASEQCRPRSWFAVTRRRRLM
ncbi:FUSC family protein (plasmid) [Streptomyces sp. NBC_01136]|uniref:FUSC family protein n=1 Tax=unclassified Streptomyces TaxID=2593676 RepID=UPI0032503AB6|nr:FUSC family protein [Streptomyces sp. NBC_01136]